MDKIIVSLLVLLSVSCSTVTSKKGVDDSYNELKISTSKNNSKAPIMGWASWNNYRVNINEDIIKSQADAILPLDLKMLVIYIST